MPIAIGDVIEVKYLTSSKPANENLSVALNVIHYVPTIVNGTGVTEQQIADNRSSAVATFYIALFNNTTRYEGCIVKRVWPVPAGNTSTSSLGNGQGVILTDQLPMQVSGIITKLTNFSGRKFRGRIYVPFPLEQDNNLTQTPTAAYLANILALGQTLLNTFVVGVPPNDSTFSPVIFHGPGASPLQTAITGLQNRAYWATQRRRMNAWRSDTLPPL